MGHISICGLICLTLLCILSIPGAQVATENVPTESECRPYIEKALNTLKPNDIDSADNPSAEVVAGGKDVANEKPNDIADTEGDDSNENDDDDKSNENDAVVSDDNNPNSDEKKDDSDEADENDSKETETEEDNKTEENDDDDDKNGENDDDDDSKEQDGVEEKIEEKQVKNDDDDSNENQDAKDDDDDNSNENDTKEENDDSNETDNKEGDDDSNETDNKEGDDDSNETDNKGEDDGDDDDSVETASSVKVTKDNAKASSKDTKNNAKDDEDDNKNASEEDDNDDDDDEDSAEQNIPSKTTTKKVTKRDTSKISKDESDENDDDDDDDDDDDNDDDDSFPVDDLLLEYEVPKQRRDRSHINELLHLDDESEAKEEVLEKVVEYTLKDLKRYYENAIKPLETLYKYRDLSNRHFGDPEIFSKPLVLLMGPWSGGKSTILNYLTDNEYTEYSLRTGAEPSPAYFNILMYGDKPQKLDGTQLSADWTFSGLQKFGEGLSDRLRGLKLPSKILKKVNIVEIPGILEVRKQVSRIFPFNDACQWFIDRADIIFLVYDPTKLDVGPETEAILDQLKGREYQTRIVLNKADQIHPEELLRVQGALIWNISPLMSSAQPPIMYTVSLWSHPYEAGAPVRLLQAQERALFQDLGQAIEHRIENKIASARRFAVRVRNHAKMVDCYLTTYYNHKTLFGNKQKISTEIVEHPQNYHIYEGLSTLTNISRYDLPDPEVYRDFFRLNPLYEFKKLTETCTYFRGCPINRLDVAIAYDLPELVNRYKRAAEAALISLEERKNNSTVTNTTSSSTTTTTTAKDRR